MATCSNIITKLIPDLFLRQIKNNTFEHQWWEVRISKVIVIALMVKSNTLGFIFNTMWPRYRKHHLAFTTQSHWLCNICSAVLKLNDKSILEPIPTQNIALNSTPTRDSDNREEFSSIYSWQSHRVYREAAEVMIQYWMHFHITLTVDASARMHHKKPGAMTQYELCTHWWTGSVQLESCTETDDFNSSTFHWEANGCLKIAVTSKE